MKHIKASIKQLKDTLDSIVFGLIIGGISSIGIYFLQSPYDEPLKAMVNENISLYTLLFFFSMNVVIWGGWSLLCGMFPKLLKKRFYMDKLITISTKSYVVFAMVSFTLILICEICGVYTEIDSSISGGRHLSFILLSFIVTFFILPFSRPNKRSIKSSRCHFITLGILFIIIAPFSYGCLLNHYLGQQDVTNEPKTELRITANNEVLLRNQKLTIQEIRKQLIVSKSKKTDLAVHVSVHHDADETTVVETLNILVDLELQCIQFTGR